MTDLDQLFPLPVLLHEKAKIEAYLEKDMTVDAVSERIALVFDRKVHYKDKQLLALIYKQLLIIIKEIITNGAVPYYLEQNIETAGFNTKITSYQHMETALMSCKRVTYGYYSNYDQSVHVTKNLDQIRARLLYRQRFDIGVSFESVLAHELRHLASSYTVGQGTKHCSIGYDNFWISPDHTVDVRNTTFNEATTEHLTIETFDDLTHRNNYKVTGIFLLTGFLLLDNQSVIRNYYMGNLQGLINDLTPYFKDRHQIYRLFSLSALVPTEQNIIEIIMIFKEVLGHKYYDYISYLVNHRYLDLSMLDPSLGEKTPIRKRG